MNTGRGAEARFGLETRARAAVLATADEIRADDVPEAPAWRSGEALERLAKRDDWDGLAPRWRRRGPGRLGAPLAAAAAIVLAAGVTAALAVNRVDHGTEAVESAKSPVASVSPAKSVASAAGKPTPAPAPYPADLEAGLIGMFVPASGAQYSAGAYFGGEYRALESQLTSACMAKAGFRLAPGTSGAIASQDVDLTQYPDLDAIAKAGAIPGDGTRAKTPATGSTAFLTADKRCGAASDTLFTPMMTAGMNLGGPFSATVAKMRYSAPVLGTVPALRACAAKNSWLSDSYGADQPINSFADFVTWVSGNLDAARGQGAAPVAMRKVEARWASVFVQCARPTVSVMEKLQLTAQQAYLASHKKQLVKLVAVARADFARAARLASA
ncbi:MAG: hypothetical protein ACRDOI_12635 [Trebonia sp.]